MRFKKMTKKLISIFMVMAIFFCNSSAGAAEKTSRLRESLENDHMYFVLTPDVLGRTNIKNYDDRFIAFSGLIKYSSISGNSKKITVFGDSNSVTVDASATTVAGIVNQLTIGDRVTVYGQVDGSEVDAEHLMINLENEPSVLSSVFYPNKELDEDSVGDLARDGHVVFRLPAAWNNEYVMGRLTNNGVMGYQFFLNAISPQNRNYPENFYIFYFNYETYLDQPPLKPTAGDHQDIEELVINNILNPLAGDIEYDIDTLKLPDGSKFDYCSTVYKPIDGNDYRLEFLFKPDDKGLVCMLYLYYPNDSAVNHLREVSYVVQTLRN